LQEGREGGYIMAVFDVTKEKMDEGKFCVKNGVVKD
jgi:hypothetical protein